MSFDLFLLRHAIAVERAMPDFKDEERPLTPEGEEKMIEAVRGLKQIGWKFDALISSPLVRAWQSAELVKAHLPFRGKIESSEDLLPGRPIEPMLRKLAKRSESSFLLVGHEPTLSQWIGELLAAEGSFRLKKGGLCHLSVEPLQTPSAELIAFLPPKVLRAMGGRG